MVGYYEMNSTLFSPLLLQYVVQYVPGSLIKCPILQFIHYRIVVLLQHGLSNIFLSFDTDLDLHIASVLGTLSSDRDDMMLVTGVVNFI